MPASELSVNLGGTFGITKSGEIKTFKYGATNSDAQFQEILAKNLVAGTFKLPRNVGQYYDSPEQVVCVVERGTFNYDSSGLLVDGYITEYEQYSYGYSSKIETNSWYKVSGSGRYFNASSFSTQSITPLDPDVSINGFYSNDNTFNKFGDQSYYANSNWASYPVSHDRSTLNSYPDGASFPVGWWNDPFNLKFSDTPSSSSSTNTTSSFTLDKTYSSDSIIQSILGSSGTPSSALSVDVSDKTLTINASSWSGSIKINLAAKASDKGETLTAKQIDFNNPDTFGSVIQGGSGNDVLMGKAGWDILDGGAGNDLIHGGNGRDIITGGVGSDELWGDFGWNTYKSEKDGYADLVAIKSDQWLENWMYGKAGNNPNGEKCDIIEGLDSTDQIRIVGAATSDLTFQANASAHGVSGIGIYAKGALEALYTGGDLSVAQIQSMTTGDASATAMANNINSYGWCQHPGTLVAS